MCIGDLGSSFFVHFLGTWMVPVEWDVPFAVGNQGTCNAQAWLLIFFWSLGFCSNVFLAVCCKWNRMDKGPCRTFLFQFNRVHLYFTDYLISVKQISDSRLEQPLWKALFLGFPFLCALAFFTYEVLASQPIFGPWFCVSHILDLHDPLYGAAFLGLLLLGFVVILWCLVRLGWVMYQAERRMDCFRQQAAGLSANRKNTIDASKQGIAYTMAYLVVWLPLAIDVSGPGHWFFIFLACTFPWRTGHTISGVDA